LHLHFIDPEILERVGPTLVLTGYRSNWTLQKSPLIKNEREALDLLSSLKEIHITAP
jgi:hypothetical protein